ncbi:MAG TPA: cation diffusion facilitator family transporter [Vicinamibacteria bacterium]|nr:cation diffusion facilitator family transporter [Vicinamibacteria bacterium]
MGHAHAGHAHAHGPDHARAASRRRLATVLALTWVFLGVEVAAGVLAGSLALLADAGHMLTDVAGLVLALAAMKFAERPPSPRRTYGYQRVEVLAAAANGVALLGVSGYVLREAWLRLQNPQPVATLEVLAVASVGLVISVAGAVLLHSSSRSSLNLRGAYNEVLADAVSSVGVIAGALVMKATGWYWVDPAVAAAIALWILPRTFQLLREALHVLLEGTPRDVDLVALRAAMEAVPGVRKVHDLHVWTLTSGIHALSAHAIVGDDIVHEEVLLALRTRVTAEFPISHLTVQLEQHCCGDHAHA